MIKQQDAGSYEYVLAKQAGNHAFFAKVTIAVALSVNDGELEITIDRAVDRRWHSAVAFGIEYGWEHVGRELPGRPSARIHVASVEWQPSDTTLMTVAFAAANAVWGAVKHTPAMVPTLDSASGSFNFPN